MTEDEKMSVENDLKISIESSFKDPIAAILLKNSNITTIQYESLIIDYISDYISDKELTYDDKALLRSKKVSKGSFNRTLNQARANIISAIYTILLLFYIGIFETPPFEEYKNLTEKLNEYLTLIRASEDPQAKQLLRRIEEELRMGIKSLAEPKALKIM